MPTFLDAIKYDMKLIKEQMMKDAVETEVIAIKKSIIAGSYGIIEVKGSYKNGEKLKIIVLKEG